MYDEAVVQYFLEHQMQLFKENVAESPEEAEEFLEDAWQLSQKYQRMSVLILKMRAQILPE